MSSGKCFAVLCILNGFVTRFGGLCCELVTPRISVTDVILFTFLSREANAGNNLCLLLHRLDAGQFHFHHLPFSVQQRMYNVCDIWSPVRHFNGRFWIRSSPLGGRYVGLSGIANHWKGNASSASNFDNSNNNFTVEFPSPIS